VSAKERVGIKVIEPAGELLGDLASLDERVAVVKESADKVDAAVKADNGELALDKE
jgi:hypothetical protein